MHVGARAAVLDLSLVAQETTLVEGLGYDNIAFGETKHSPFLPLVLVASTSKTLSFGSSVAVAFPRAPHIMANIAWDLASYSEGRFTLGLGTQVKGHNERRFSVSWHAPAERLRDYIGCMRAIWDSWQNGTIPAYVGPYYRYQLTSPYFNPGPIAHPRIPIVLAAANPAIARLAGEISDGISMNPFSTFRYMREVLIPAVHEGALLAGRDPASLELHAGGMIATGRTPADVSAERERARRQVAFYGSTRTYARVMQLHGWHGLSDELHWLSANGKWDQMSSRISDDILDEFCVSGTWAELPGLLVDKYQGLGTHIFLQVRPRGSAERAEARALIAALRAIPIASAAH